MLRLLLGGLALLLLQACSPTKVTVATSPDLGKYRIARIAVLPFETRRSPQPAHEAPLQFLVPEGATRSEIFVIDPPVNGALPPEVTTAPSRSPGLVAIPGDAAERVTRMVYQKLRDRTALDLVAPEEARRQLGDLFKDLQHLPPEEAARRSASRLSADAVLVGRLLVYQERGAGEPPAGGSGSPWGGETAAVGFEVRLIAADGTTLWEGNYYEKQRPMTQDLLGVLERGPLFLTADELANYGATKLAKRFPLQ